jgi:hypothetical protein
VGHARARKVPAQLVEDEDYQLRYERVAGIDVAKAKADVCTRLPAAREGGRRVSRVETAGATAREVLALAGRLIAGALRRGGRRPGLADRPGSRPSPTRLGVRSRPPTSQSRRHRQAARRRRNRPVPAGGDSAGRPSGRSAHRGSPAPVAFGRRSRTTRSPPGPAASAPAVAGSTGRRRTPGQHSLHPRAAKPIEDIRGLCAEPPPIGMRDGQAASRSRISASASTPAADEQADERGRRSRLGCTVRPRARPGRSTAGHGGAVCTGPGRTRRECPGQPILPSGGQLRMVRRCERVAGADVAAVVDVGRE